MRQTLILTLIFLINFTSAVNNSELVFDSDIDFLPFYKLLRDCSIKFTDFTDIDKECAAQLDLSCSNNLLLTFLDASAKFPYTSLNTSTRTDYGNFDQCMAIDSTFGDERIRGRYCLVGLVILDLNHMNDSNLAYKLATCTPDKCSANDLNTLLNRTLQWKLPFPIFQDVGCKSNEGKEFRTEDIVTSVIILVCIGLMCSSTIYDIYLNKLNKRTAHPLFLSFSVYSNGKKLIQTSKGNREQIQIFHGLKTISMIWIISGHGANGWKQVPLFNAEDVVTYTQHFYSFYLFSSYLAVDTFFYISGFLMAYQYLKQKTKPLMTQMINLPQALLHRYLRLTPAVVILYLVSISLMAHAGDGPLYDTAADVLAEPCRKYAWQFFLYIQNYYNYDDICLIHTWYLSSDMQLFLVGIIMMIPISLMLKNPKNFRMCMIGLLIFNVILTIIPLVVRLTIRSYVNEYDAHSRLMIYFIGVMAGAYMRLKKDEPFFGKKYSSATLSIVNLLIWIVILAGMFVIVLFQRQVYNDMIQDQVTWFDCIKRPAWAIGLTWMIYSSYHGYGGVIDWFLSTSIMQVGGRLSYCMYLTHGLVVAYDVMVQRTRQYFNDYIMFYHFCGYLILTIFLSFFWTLAFESPLIIIEKFLLGGGGRRRPLPPPPSKKEDPLPSEPSKLESIEKVAEDPSTSTLPKLQPSENEYELSPGLSKSETIEHIEKENNSESLPPKSESIKPIELIENEKEVLSASNKSQPVELTENVDQLSLKPEPSELPTEPINGEYKINVES